jgi:hypothetical protein
MEFIQRSTERHIASDAHLFQIGYFERTTIICVSCRFGYINYEATTNLTNRYGYFFYESIRVGQHPEKSFAYPWLNAYIAKLRAVVLVERNRLVSREYLKADISCLSARTCNRQHGTDLIVVY